MQANQSLEYFLLAKMFPEIVYFIIIILLFLFIPTSYGLGITRGKAIERQSEGLTSCCKYKVSPKYHAYTGYPKTLLFNNMYK